MRLCWCCDITSAGALYTHEGVCIVCIVAGTPAVWLASPDTPDGTRVWLGECPRTRGVIAALANTGGRPRSTVGNGNAPPGVPTGWKEPLPPDTREGDINGAA